MPEKREYTYCICERAIRLIEVTVEAESDDAARKYLSGKNPRLLKEAIIGRQVDQYELYQFHPMHLMLQELKKQEEKERDYSPHFNMDDVFENINCRECKSHRVLRATRDDPETQICDNGDFGSEKPCAEILGAVERLIEDGALATEGGYLGTADYIKKAELSTVDYGVDFDGKPYWWVPYNDGKPTGFATLEEVWRCFV